MSTRTITIKVIVIFRILKIHSKLTENGPDDRATKGWKTAIKVRSNNTNY